jgi:hypothetical protein
MTHIYKTLYIPFAEKWGEPFFLLKSESDSDMPPCMILSGGKFRRHEIEFHNGRDVLVTVHEANFKL